MNTTGLSGSLPLPSNNIEKNKLLSILKSLATNSNDKEYGHQSADRVLLNYINDPEVTKAFNDVEKWYC